MKKIPVDYLAHCETDKKLKAHLSLKSERELLDFLGCDFFYLPGRDISQNFLLNLAMNPEVIHTLIDRMTEMYLPHRESENA